MTQVESSDLYVESTEFLDAWFMSELELFTSAVASYFLDKTYFSTPTIGKANRKPI